MVKVSFRAPGFNIIDMLISLKVLVLQRAKIIGHEELAEKFDLKMLRALGLILMEYSKQKFKDLSHIPGSAEPSSFINGCNLLKFNPSDIMSIEELASCINIDSRRRPPKRYVEAARLREEAAAANRKKQKS
ncbi:hypothetical protein Patl1_11779 [Pistacia atlantica]|uniref:Uncharacterized protein n=1 Tax=Pistacia atlantica TaxID=434234 RepID=A0ACC1A3Q9_9ROSI|nr:hypothetical protein Patl1_11779 [Pistacia atlantica]